MDEAGRSLELDGAGSFRRGNCFWKIVEELLRWWKDKWRSGFILFFACEGMRFACCSDADEPVSRVRLLALHCFNFFFFFGSLVGFARGVVLYLFSSGG